MDSQSRVVILCGKGGVGKTTLSLALGFRHAQLDRKVVIVSSHPLSELALAVSLDGLARQYPIAARNLFIVHLDAREMLDDIIRNNFPVDWMARRVLNSRLYQNLMEIAPGLKEFHFLAHLQQLAERRATAGEDSRAYDLLLWDAPATGHFLSTLRSARNFRSYLTGPLAAAGEIVNRFYSTVENITLLPVTIAEEMPIEETVELCAAMQAEFQLKPGAVLVNLASPLLAQPAEQERLEREAADSHNAALRFAVDRAGAERERVDSLRARVAAPLVSVPRVVRWSSDLDMVGQLSQFLELPGLQVGAP